MLIHWQKVCKSLEKHWKESSSSLLIPNFVQWLKVELNVLEVTKICLNSTFFSDYMSQTTMVITLQ